MNTSFKYPFAKGEIIRVNTLHYCPFTISNGYFPFLFNEKNKKKHNHSRLCL